VLHLKGLLPQRGPHGKGFRRCSSKERSKTEGRPEMKKRQQGPPQSRNLLSKDYQNG
jgi:hypothetical protein